MECAMSASTKLIFLMIDTTLIDKLKVFAAKEKKINEYKRRIRVKGQVIGKKESKKGNILLKIRNDDEEIDFTVINTHKERYSLAEKVGIGKNVSIEGIPKFRMIICTRLKEIEGGKQSRLDYF